MNNGKIKFFVVLLSLLLGVTDVFCQKAQTTAATDFDAYLKRPTADASFTFSVVGDIQGKGRSEVWKNAALWLSKRKPSFWVPVGDLVDHGLRKEEWDAFVEDGAALLKVSPIIPVIGNHECYLDKAPEQFPALFYEQFPFFKLGKERPDGWYSFDYSNAHFVVLNNYPATGDRNKDKNIIREEEKQWLERDLSSSRKRWKFVFMHEPLYSSGPHGGDSNWLIPVWGELFDKYNVNVVFSGHTHAFEVTCGIRNGKKTEDTKSGTIYYNCAGVNYSAVPKGDWFTASSQKIERICMIPLVKVESDSVTIETWDLSSDTVFHRTVIGK